MSSTFAQMQARIADDLNRTDLTSQIQLAINRAIEYYWKNFRFWFNETTGTFNTVANQMAYGTADGLPSDIAEIDFVKLAVSSSNNIKLIPRTYGYIQEKNISNIPGVPSDYAIYQQKMYLYLTPDQAYTVTVSYAKSYTALVNASDTNDFTTYAEDVIESRASWWLYKRILKDYEAAMDSKQEESDHLYALLAETDRRTTSKSLRPTQF